MSNNQDEKITITDVRSLAEDDEEIIWLETIPAKISKVPTQVVENASTKRKQTALATHSSRPLPDANRSVVVMVEIYETQDTVHMEDKTFTRTERSEKRLRMAVSDYKDIFCKK